MGIVSTGSSIGGVVFPITVSRLIYTVGYPWAMRASAILILGLLLVAIATVRSRFPPARSLLAPQQLTAPFKEIGFVGMTTGVGLLTFAIFVPLNYVATQGIEEAGMDPQLAQYLIAILNAAR